MWRKKEYEQSEWMKGLLRAEQHSYEGYEDSYLLKIIDKKLYDDQVSTETHQGVYDFFWYKENVLEKLNES